MVSAVKKSDMTNEKVSIIMVYSFIISFVSLSTTTIAAKEKGDAFISDANEIKL